MRTLTLVVDKGMIELYRLCTITCDKSLQQIISLIKWNDTCTHSAHNKNIQIIKNILQQLIDPRIEALAQQFVMTYKVQELENKESLFLSTPKYTRSCEAKKY
jgi:hypothetical protein